MSFETGQRGEHDYRFECTVEVEDRPVCRPRHDEGTGVRNNVSATRARDGEAISATARARETRLNDLVERPKTGRIERFRVLAPRPHASPSK